MNKIILASLFIISLFCLTWIPTKTDSTAVETSQLIHKTSMTSSSDASIAWNKTEHDFGAIPQNIPVSYEFEITNTGSEAITILNVKTSCGCTAAGYSEDPLEPGASTHLTAQYNAKNGGVFSKEIKVFTDAREEPYILKIKGEVEV